MPVNATQIIKVARAKEKENQIEETANDVNANLEKEAKVKVKEKEEKEKEKGKGKRHYYIGDDEYDESYDYDYDDGWYSWPEGEDKDGEFSALNFSHLERVSGSTPLSCLTCEVESVKWRGFWRHSGTLPVPFRPATGGG